MTEKNEEARRNGADEEKTDTDKDVIAFRRACKATGTGLSHYILMDRKGE